MGDGIVYFVSNLKISFLLEIKSNSGAHRFDFHSTAKSILITFLNNGTGIPHILSPVYCPMSSFERDMFLI